MRIPALACLFAAALAAQTRQSATYGFDANGHRTDWSQSRSGDGRSSETVINLSGRRVPVEQVEERLVSRQDGVEIVERTTRRFDHSGAPLPPEKERIETVNRPDGGSTVTTTLYRGNLSGGLDPAGREVKELRKSGSQILTETTVERPTINGTFELQERRSGQSGESGSDETTYRRDLNGRLSESARQVSRLSNANGEAVEQTDRYESVDGHLRLARQEIARTRRTADGGEHKEIDVYGLLGPGKATPESGTLQLRERQSYATSVSADGTTIQVYSVRKASPNDPGRLEAAHKVSETVTTRR